MFFFGSYFQINWPWYSMNELNILHQEKLRQNILHRVWHVLKPKLFENHRAWPWLVEWNLPENKLCRSIPYMIVSSPNWSRTQAELILCNNMFWTCSMPCTKIYIYAHSGCGFLGGFFSTRIIMVCRSWLNTQIHWEMSQTGSSVNPCYVVWMFVCICV